MRTPLAWHKVTHNKLRTATSLVGVSFAIILIFMQIGFYDSCFRSATMVLDQLDFDLVLVSPLYEAIRVTGSIPRRRLVQARAVPGVAGVAPCYVASGYWRLSPDGMQREIMALGIDPRQPIFRDPELRSSAPRLFQEDTGIWDTKAHGSYEQVKPGNTCELENRRIDIVATYAHGTGFVSPATILVSDQTLARTFGVPLNDVGMGLVKLEPGAEPAKVLRLREVLPSDTRVFRRSDLEAIDQHYWMGVKPIGIMFFSGVLLALVVGAVIIYQILASEVLNYRKDYATLQAMGYSKGYVFLLVLQQAGLFAVIGFVPAAAIASVMFFITRLITGLPMLFTWDRALLVLGLSLAMCSLSGLLAIRKVSRTDPVDLF